MWVVKRTDTFLKHLKKQRNNHNLLSELDNKITRLRENPQFGGNLAGPLHGKKSTRLTGNYRLIFDIDEKENVVYLIALDHRGSVYD